MAVKNSKAKKKKAQPEKSKNHEIESVEKAHEQAETDIEKDPEINIGPEKGDDLDEGELARLEGEK